LYYRSRASDVVRSRWSHCWSGACEFVSPWRSHRWSRPCNVVPLRHSRHWGRACSVVRPKLSRHWRWPSDNIVTRWRCVALTPGWCRRRSCDLRVSARENYQEKTKSDYDYPSRPRSCSHDWSLTHERHSLTELKRDCHRAIRLKSAALTVAASLREARASPAGRRLRASHSAKRHGV